MGSANPASRAGALVLACGVLCGMLAWADEPPPASPAPRTWDFQADEPGKPPAGFELATTMGIEGARWEVRAEGEARVLVQTDAQPVQGRYAMAVVKEVTARDLRLSVRGKPLAGTLDQAVGLVWRWQDQNDYYLVRSNVLERNVRLYRVVRGDRTKLASAEELPLERDAWHTLEVEQVGAKITVSLNGKRLFQAEDTTWAKAGRVGVWVKADSVTCFDDLTLTTLAD